MSKGDTANLNVSPLFTRGLLQFTTRSGVDYCGRSVLHFTRLIADQIAKPVAKLRRGRLLIGPALLIALFCVSALGERLPVKIYTSADGLGSGFVDYIYRDSRGFMWFCTRDGLSRFDGSSFVTYRVGDGTSPPGIETIVETRAGVYYVSTTGGTYRLRPDTVSKNQSSDKVMTADFLFGSRGIFFEDRKGNVWITTGPLSKLVDKNGKIELEKYDLGLPEMQRTLSISEIAESADGSLWFNSSWGLIRLLPDGRIVYFPFETSINSGNNSLIVDKADNVWITKESKILVIRPEPIENLPAGEKLITKSLEPAARHLIAPGEDARMPARPGEIFEFYGGEQEEFVESSYAKRLFQTSDGVVWITAEKHLVEVSGGKFDVHGETQGLPQVMTRMGEDSAGNLWIASHAGLGRLNRSGLVSYGMDDGAPSSRFFTAFPDADGAPIFAGRGHALNRLENGKLTTVRPDVPKDALYLWTSRFALRTSGNDWWLLSSEGLYRFSGIREFSQLNGMKPTAIYNASTGLKADAAFQIFEDSKKRVWVSTRGIMTGGHGLSVTEPGGLEFRPFAKTEGFPDGRSAASYAEDRRGRIWLGFYEGGLAVYDDGKFRVFGKENGLPANGHITDIHIAANGTMWLATSVQGLYRAVDTESESPRFEPVGIESTPNSHNVRTITEDKFGRLYLGSARGVERYCPETGHVKRFTVSEGLAADFVVDSYRDENDDLWFITFDGASKLKPLDDERPPPPQVLIGRLSISGNLGPISELGAVSVDTGDLAHTDNNFEINYFGLDFRAGEFLRYQYKLEGADQDWSPPTDQRSVQYANLGPASYRFLVRAINTEGAVSETPAVISFRILRPVWQRWWFLLLLAVAVGSIVYFLYRYRTARLLEINAALEDARRAEERLRRAREERLIELEHVRSRIATDLHDDIGASLTQIAILSEVAQARNGNGSGGTLEKITEVSNELVGTMSDIVWSINPAKDHLSDLTQRMRRFAADVLAPRGITVKFHVPEDGAAIVVNSNVRREVFLVFKEAVNNIAKHSEATQVDVKLAISSVEIFLEIRDDGVGFENKPPSFEDTFSSEGYSGNGIPSMQKRAAAMDGRFEINSKAGGGTVVTLRLPRELAFDDSLMPENQDLLR